jgi:hypothetical protein
MVDEPENPEPQDKKIDPFDFDDTGEVAGYISLDQARVLAMQPATREPGAYGDQFRDVLMAFNVENEEDTEDYYVITLSFRPQGEFRGTSGEEQFFIELVTLARRGTSCPDQRANRAPQTSAMRQVRSQPFRTSESTGS